MKRLMEENQGKKIGKGQRRERKGKNRGDK